MNRRKLLAFLPLSFWPFGRDKASVPAKPAASRFAACQTPLFDARDLSDMIERLGASHTLPQLVRFLEVAVQTATGRDDICISYTSFVDSETNPSGNLGRFCVVCGVPSKGVRSLTPIAPFPRHATVSIAKPDGSREIKLLTGADYDAYCKENNLKPIQQ